jgi:hypothetical protein
VGNEAIATQDTRLSRHIGTRADVVPAELHARLHARRAEIEEAVLTRAYAVSDPAGVDDPTYAEGLRAAIGAAVDYALMGTASSERSQPQIPAALLVQARVAARSGVGLDTVLRRYFAGYALLGDFLIEEAEALGLRGAELKRLLRRQSALFDRVVAAISEEHSRDARAQPQTSERRKLELVRRALDGEQPDATELSYDLSILHVGIVAEGAGAEEAIRELAAGLGSRLLLVCPDESRFWAWMGGSAPHGGGARMGPAAHQARLSIGEPAEGPAGWRLTHQQAKTAFPIAQRGEERFVRYADVALIASMLQDDLLTASLRRIYLTPLEAERDGGEMAKKALRAYFAADRNVSSAAAALGVHRNTITKQIRAVEAATGRAFAECAIECDAALRLEELERPDAA